MAKGAAFESRQQVRFCATPRAEAPQTYTVRSTFGVRFLAMFRKLDPEQILETASRLERRIEERLPGAGLAQLAQELTQVRRKAHALASWLAAPNEPLRTFVSLAIVLLIAVVLAAAITLRGETGPHDWADWAQRLEAMRDLGIRAQIVLQATEGGVPLLGDLVQVFAGFFDALGAEFPDALAALAGVVNEAGVGQSAQVLGDGLAGDVAAFAQAHDR